MEIRMTAEEFNQVRRFVGATKNADIITSFNKILNDELPIKTTRVPITQEVLLEIDPKSGEDVLRIIANNGGTFGEMLRRDIAVASVPKWINFIKQVGASIGRLFT